MAFLVCPALACPHVSDIFALFDCSSGVAWPITPIFERVQTSCYRHRVSWFNAIALRAVVIGLIGGADVGLVAGSPFPGFGTVLGVLFGAVAGVPISLACAYAAAQDISSSPTPRRTTGPALARPARTGCVFLSVIVALPAAFFVSPIGALIFAGTGLLIMTPLAVLIARATAPWCLAEAVPKIAPAKRWFVFTAFATPVVVAIAASLVWLRMA